MRLESDYENSSISSRFVFGRVWKNAQSNQKTLVCHFVVEQVVDEKEEQIEGRQAYHKNILKSPGIVVKIEPKEFVHSANEHIE